MVTQDTINILNGLIETCRDGEEGFQEAGQYLVQPYLKQLFALGSNERSRFVGELNEAVRFLGGEPVTSGSMTGAVQRTWIDIKGTLMGRDDESILNECERGEDAAVEAYRSALEVRTLPAGIRALIERQANGIQSMHDQIRQQRNRAAYA